MNLEHVDPSRLRVDPKFAKELPPPLNISSMRESIAEHGVLIPLLATRDWLLLDGHRRLELAIELKKQVVPVLRLDLAADVSWWATVRIATNVHRRQLSPAQIVALGTSIERIEKVRARDRMCGRTTNVSRGGTLGHGVPGYRDPGSTSEPVRATAVVADSLGLSRHTYERARAVLDRGPTEVAKKMLAGDISIVGAYKKLQRHELAKKSARETRVLAPAGAGVYRGTNLSVVPAGRYRTIYADPPWPYDDEGCEGGPPYETLTVEEIAELDVGRLAHPEGCHLWMWTTWPKIRDGIPHRVLAAWGFAWKGEVVWDKGRATTGRWIRSSSEVLILGVRDAQPLLSDYVEGLFDWPRPPRSAGHSAKPPEARTFVQTNSPGPYVELFGRKVPAPWDVFGHEAERAKGAS